MQNIKELPCKITSSWKPSDGCSYKVDIYTQNGTFLVNQTWSDVPPFCEFIWNITSPEGTYRFNSTVDTGFITLTKEDNMLSIIILQIFLVVFFILLALPHKLGIVKIAGFGMAILELFLTIWIVYINEAGGSFLELYWINVLVTLLVGIPFSVFSLYVLNIKLMNVQDNEIKDDPYTKYVFGK